MRAIDNMTPQEIETLALKGMTAPRTASERKMIRAGLTQEAIDAGVAATQPQGNKAQPQHSPLRNVIVYLESGVVQDVTVPAGVEVTVIDQDEIECGEKGTFTYEGESEVNHADKLAEALEETRDLLIAYSRDFPNHFADLDARFGAKAVIQRGYKAITDWRAQ